MRRRRIKMTRPMVNRTITQGTKIEIRTTNGIRMPAIEVRSNSNGVIHDVLGQSVATKHHEFCEQIPGFNGPSAVPRKHVLVTSHQPHPGFSAHAVHDVLTLHSMDVSGD